MMHRAMGVRSRFALQPAFRASSALTMARFKSEVQLRTDYGKGLPEGQPQEQARGFVLRI